MKWMEHFLSGGQLAGKIICPNKKCGAKLGNYDWAGVCCGCKQWVTPVRRCVFLFFFHPYYNWRLFFFKGFCINRSKVDEIVWLFFFHLSLFLAMCFSPPSLYKHAFHLKHVYVVVFLFLFVAGWLQYTFLFSSSFPPYTQFTHWTYCLFARHHTCLSCRIM